MGRVLVGVDLVQISEIAASITRFGARFLERVFTEREIRYCGAHPHAAVERYAARFAAKEATMKVLRPVDESLPFRCIEVLREEDGAPVVMLHDNASRLAERSRITALSVSLSHEADYATAVVVAELGTRTARSRLTQRPSAHAWRRASGQRIVRQKFGSER